MEVYLNLAITSQEFFDFLYESIINDVKDSTNQTITKNNVVSGYSYTKTLKNKLGREGKVRVTIEEFEVNRKYVASFKSNQGDNFVTYDIEDLEDGTVDVTYSEDYVAADRMKSWNFDLMSFFMKKRNKKKGISTLRNIENYIIYNRKED